MSGHFTLETGVVDEIVRTRSVLPVLVQLLLGDQNLMVLTALGV